MARIYVSSTYLDLQEHRQKVREVIRRMGHEDVAMEYYVAEDQRPVERCLSDVASCDLYVGLFAWRYGWVPKAGNPRKLSATEMEYRRAQEEGKPCRIFLIDEAHPWPRKLMDNPSDLIDSLRSRLAEDHGSGPHFRDPEHLGRLVAEAIHLWGKEREGTTPCELIPEVDLVSYTSVLKKRYQGLDLDALTPPQKEEYLQIQLHSVFVEQSVRADVPPLELPKELWERLQREQKLSAEELPRGVSLEDLERARNRYTNQPPKSVLAALGDPASSHAVVLGDPGSGKSTLTRYLLLSTLDPSLDRSLGSALEGAIPLLIELRTYAGIHTEGRCEGFLEFLGYIGELEGWNLPVEKLEQHLAVGGCALALFDGLDEIFDPELRERVARRIAGFATSYPGVRVIVTSRIVGYKPKVLADAGFVHFTLQDLDEKQVSTFVRRWYDLALSDRPDDARARVERIERAFRESPSIRQLAGNPMLLTILAIIGKHQELPRERWKLYDHAAGVLVQHWDVNKHLRDRGVEAELITEADKKHLLRELAFQMQSGAGGLAGNYIHREQLEETFEKYLKRRFYGNAPERAVMVARRMIEQFRERNFILSLHGASLYGFVHRAFLEFFCASAFVHRFEKTKEMTLDQIKEEAYGRNWEDESWHEVLRLICGMIDSRFASQIIDYLVREVWPDWLDELPRRAPWNIVLAVQCLGEVDDLRPVEVVAVDLLRCCCGFIERMLYDSLYLPWAGVFFAPPVAAIGTRWPGRDLVKPWFRDFLIPLFRDGELDHAEARVPGTFVGALVADDSEFAESFKEELSALSRANLGVGGRYVATVDGAGG